MKPAFMILPILRAARTQPFGLFVGACIFWMTILPPSPACSAQFYMDIPSIPGEKSIPGHPHVIGINSFFFFGTRNHIGGGGGGLAPIVDFAVTKPVDASSPHISAAVALGTPLSTVSLLVSGAGPRDAVFTFQDVLATSYQQSSGNGNVPNEVDGFHFHSFTKMYLELPGIVGNSSTGFQHGLMEIQSFALTADSFSIVKAVDATSPGITAAVDSGTPFSTAQVLFYSGEISGPPDATLGFGNVLASGRGLVEGGPTLLENDSFNFASITSNPATATPEPGSLTLLGLGFASFGGMAWWKKRKAALTV